MGAAVPRSNISIIADPERSVHEKAISADIQAGVVYQLVFVLADTLVQGIGGSVEEADLLADFALDHSTSSDSDGQAVLADLSADVGEESALGALTGSIDRS